MSGDIFQIGISGLEAAQIGITTTGQNISNATTPGYSEEVAQQETAPEQEYGFGYVGQGVDVSTITREFNSLLAQQINSIQAESSQTTSYSNMITPIDNIIANPTAGLSPALQSFFSSLQNLSADPSGTPSLQTALSGAQTLVTQFQALQSQLTQSATSVNAQISTSVNAINTDAQQLASVNQAITEAIGTSGGQPPNALLDQRDQLVNTLSQQIQVTVVAQGSQYNIFIGNGQPLVLGNQTYNLTTTPSASNPADTEVGYDTNGTVTPIPEADLTGGTLGGLFAFRTNSLVPVQNTLGQIAIVLGSAVNAQNELGQTINGTMGGALFTVGSPVVNTNSNNTGNAQLSATITDPGALNADNYSLTYNGSNYVITDTTTNTVESTFASFPATPTQGVNIINGVTYTLTSGTMNSGDSFMISPTSAGALGFGMATTDPTQIGTASPIATSSASTNTGTGVITAGSVTTGFTLAGANLPITLTYDSGTNSISGFPAGDSIVATVNGVSTTYAAGSSVPYTAGMTMAFGNMSVGLSGSPANGDSYTIAQNITGSGTGGTGDNSNVLLMNALQTQNVMNNGTATFQDTYSQIVDAVGNTTSQLTTNGTTQTNLLNSATQQQQSTSGVNLDQETVNLMQYQQVYESCGRLITVANQNFTTLIGLSGNG